MTNIDNPKKSTKSSTKRQNSKKFCILQNILQNVLFLFTSLSQGNFLYCPMFYIVTTNLSCPTDMKQYLLHWFFFRQDFRKFCQVTKHQSRRVFFFSVIKNHFFTDDRERTKTILVPFSRRIIKLFLETANIQLNISDLTKY